MRLWMSDEPENTKPDKEATIPSFQHGVRVRETGIALVHEGEYILPAPDSEAEIEPADVSLHTVINYYFPVEIEIVGHLPDDEREAIEASIWGKLFDAFDNLA